MAQRIEGVKEVRAGAKKVSENSQGEMIEKHSKKHQPSCYVSGDSVLVLLTKGNKIKKAHIVKGTVLKATYAKHRYYVKHNDGAGWYAASRLAAENPKSWLEEMEVSDARRIVLMCQ